MSVNRSDLLAGPPAPDTDTLSRWLESQRRRRLLEGLWKADLREALAKEFEPRRRRALGLPDTTKNVFRSVINQVAVLYDRPPVVDNADGQSASAMRAIVDGAGLWQLSSGLQRLVIGQREAAYRFDVVIDDATEEARLLARVVPADLLWAYAPPDAPDAPEIVHEYRLRTIGDRDTWTRDVLSIADPEDPVFRVESANGEIDLCEACGLPFGGLRGDAFPYRLASGRPILPIVLYHAIRTGRLWDPYNGIELVDGTLAVAGMWTQFRHLLRDASWPQRYVLNAQVDGLEVDKSTGDASVSTDPASLLQFRPKVPGQGSMIGQFAPGGNPLEFGDAIRAFALDLVADFDLSPSDVARTHVDARSGYAIEITRDGQRRAQRRYEPEARRGDEAALTVIAALWNRATGERLAENDYSVRYLGLPLSHDERRLVMEDHKMRLEAGISSPVALLAAVDGITPDQARAQLLEFELDNARFGGGASVAAAPEPSEEPEAELPEA